MQQLWNRFQKSPSAAADLTATDVGESQDDVQGRLGMFLLVDKPSDAKGIVDIIALHGLNGHPTEIWTAYAKETRLNWLKDLLPTAIPNARIMSYGYESSVQFSKSTADIATFAEDLLAEIMSWRMDEEKKARPIIFICHSLGGIVFKQALVKARERDRFTELLKKIRGVAFFGTPHAGSSLAKFGNIMASIIKLSTLGTTTNARVVAVLKNNSETLWGIARSFVDRRKALPIVSFYETREMAYLNSLVGGIEPERKYEIDH
ncbi:hypothetical protein N7520_011061 [Penicillium odoratum]|uniref:uncharacterized protein n=1 Tax=Penicillium odoratum TaxID=1167516 RepID=UPI002548A54F|nr:uncharacterized protein N7520_011061 [Penicillium odoratum]KAJ5745879.1 hypothetical protein N7520_011061 [Penicillium odoratum]